MHDSPAMRGRTEGGTMWLMFYSGILERWSIMLRLSTLGRRNQQFVLVLLYGATTESQTVRRLSEVEHGEAFLQH